MSKSMHRFKYLLPLVLITFMGCATTRTHESTGEYVDDSVLTLKVKTAILGDNALNAAEINVETFKGTVQLSGFVNSQSDIDHAVVVAGNVDGVTSVKNHMQLKR